MQINLSNFRQELVVNSTDYLNKNGKLFLFKSESVLDGTGNIVTASQAEVGYALLPLVSFLTEINVYNLINFLFLALISITLLVVLYCSFNISTNKISKLFSLIFFLLIIVISYPLYLNENANYSIGYFFCMLTMYPIYLLSKKNIKLSKFIFIILLTSFLASIYGLFRDYIYLNLIFMFGYILFFKIKSKKFLKIICFIFLISPIFITHSINQKVSEIMNINYNELVKSDQENITYKSHKGEILLGQSVWHSIYASLDYLKNDIVKGNALYDDQHIRDLLKRDHYIDYHFYTSDDEIVKKELFKILINYPTLIFKNLFAKLGVILGFTIIFANFGLLLFLNLKINNEVKIFLLINLFIASLFPLVAVPTKFYLGGVISSSLIILYFFILNLLNKLKLK